MAGKLQADLVQLFNDVTAYTGEGTRRLDFPPWRVQLYKGAMEIPMVAFYPAARIPLDAAWVQEFAALLATLGLDLECVEEENNYKINTSDTKLYLGRVTGEALKLHAPRMKEMGFDTFRQIVGGYFRLHEVRS